jgi:EAL domain-containing protein (putative c-di-GMP-specific phosphodiesterase class I)
MEQFARESSDEFLFINVRLQWCPAHAELADFYNQPEDIPTLTWAEEFNIPPEKLVIEITEEKFNEDSELYREVLRYYKGSGCKIAIDDYGKGASNIDRLAQIRPDIMKIDMDYVHQAENSFHHYEYLKSIAVFAESVGIEVLYEGIETQRQLEICMDSQGKYYQGFLLSRPSPSIVAARVDLVLFSKIFSNVITKFKRKLVDSNRLRDNFEAKIKVYIVEYPMQTSDMDEYLETLLKVLPETVKRIFLCNQQGIQISRNIERKDGGIKLPDFRRKNWAWRSYYQKALAVYESGKKAASPIPIGT